MKLTYDLFSKDSPMSIEEHSEIISQLKFIGKIQEGEKINVKYMYIQPSNIFTKLNRTFYHTDNRKNTYNFVVKTVSRSFDIVSVYLNSERICDKELAKDIIRDIRDSKEGIKNLKKTYHLDRIFCCNLDTFVQKMDSFLGEIKRKYPEYYPEEITITPPLRFFPPSSSSTPSLEIKNDKNKS